MFLVDGRFLVLVGDSPDGGRCVPRRWACLLVLVGDSPDGGRCVPRRLECLLVLVCDRFRRLSVCSSSVGVPPGVGV